MFGAILGDFIGSRYEFNNIKTKDFKLFTDNFVTDDSIMTIAIYKAIKEGKEKGNYGELAIKYMQAYGREYPYAGYGGRFASWLLMDNPRPYGSYGNGSAMRISSVGFMFDTIEEVKNVARQVTEVTHNHEEGIKGAEATALCILLARQGKSKEEIKKYVEKNYYKLDFTLDEIRPTYHFNETCQGSVPQAIKAFLESTSYEDAIRNAISIGGDSDTIACIAGGIAEAYYGVPIKLDDIISMKQLKEIVKKIAEEFGIDNTQYYYKTIGVEQIPKNLDEY